jgi:hypothetical protein
VPGSRGDQWRVDREPCAGSFALLERETDVEQLGAVEGVEQQLGRIEVRGGKVEIGGESSGVARAELPQRCSSLERNPEVEDALVVQERECVVLRDVQQCRVCHSAAPLEVARQISLRDHRGRSAS